MSVSEFSSTENKNSFVHSSTHPSHPHKELPGMVKKRQREDLGMDFSMHTRLLSLFRIGGEEVQEKKQQNIKKI